MLCQSPVDAARSRLANSSGNTMKLCVAVTGHVGDSSGHLSQGVGHARTCEMIGRSTGCPVVAAHQDSTADGESGRKTRLCCRQGLPKHTILSPSRSNCTKESEPEDCST